MTNDTGDKQTVAETDASQHGKGTHVGTGRRLNDLVIRRIGVDSLHVFTEYVNLLLAIPTSRAVAWGRGRGEEA